MITIKHLSGKKGEDAIPDDRDRITFGRLPECDVVFPENERLVGRKHFALVRRGLSDWHVELSGNHYVEIDGHPAYADEHVPNNAEIRLGNEKGPSFRFIESAPNDVAGAVTATQQPVVPPPKRLRFAIRVGIAAFLVLLTAGLGWVWFDQRQKEEMRNSAIEELKEIEERQAELASERISKEDQRRLARAAFLVMEQDQQGRLSAFGTAWPVAPNMLATNAHVAERRPDMLSNGSKLVVRAPGENGNIYEVIQEKIHPGWSEFYEFVKSKDVVIENIGPSGATEIETNLLPVYDVAILTIDGEVSPDAILKIAPIEELHKLEPGAPLASAGYPLEFIGGAETQTMGATPQLKFGAIAGFTDYFSLPTNDVAQRRLLHHSIPVTGGASGSAIIGPDGHVIALVNAGSILPSQEATRIPNAALVNFGQRADLVIDLIEGTEEESLARDRAYWDKQVALFKRGPDVVIPAALARIAPPQKGATLELISEEKGSLTQSDVEEREDKRFRIKGHKINLKAGNPYVFLVYPERNGAWLFYQDKDFAVKASNKKEILCPTLSYTPKMDESGYVVVQGADDDTAYVLQVYSWKLTKPQEAKN